MKAEKHLDGYIKQKYLAKPGSHFSKLDMIEFAEAYFQHCLEEWNDEKISEYVDKKFKGNVGQGGRSTIAVGMEELRDKLKEVK